MSQLRTEKLSVGYPGVTVARDISFTLEAGEVLAVLGPNGAGKTTLLLTLAGLLPPIDGTAVAGAHSLDGSARRAREAGVVLVPDSRALFTQLTPQENLRLAARKASLIDEAYDLFPALVERRSVKVGALSGGEQQMLAVARALVQEPKVLLIDEMSMGLAPVVVERMMPVVRRVADERGASVVLVEQHVRLALGVADRAMVLVHGEVSLEGSAAAVRADPGALEAAYLGAVTSP